nr:MAG TPA_asm: hypothetical protein [Caudoviricetes sp.]
MNSEFERNGVCRRYSLVVFAYPIFLQTEVNLHKGS